ncbi:hypothetical protein H6P81_011319 [Aristolochia fimbriata]|uniref:Uncharacterized protein n=1 Tax=Aristolochia fimbriata TaxID=158543 RepID=A0AAV7ES00_ARIFI|nr:hypothetical protein H6P81_011319 [Aristolochia fimbriata]
MMYVYTKSLESLGIRKIKEFNIALLLKWRWKLNACLDSQWEIMISRKLGVEEHEQKLGWHPPIQISNLWKQIYKKFEIFRKHKGVLVGDGAKTEFLSDWLDYTRLKNTFPKLFSIARNSSISVKEILNGGPAASINGQTIFRRELKD